MDRRRCGSGPGDWVSYWLGYKFKEPIGRVWPLARYPDLLPRGHAFMERWGVLSIFIGRFFGPLRAAVPLVAGILEMPYWTFQIANFISVFVWVWSLLAIGDLGAGLLQWLA
jgi:membrane protein DedA with SNARE-associated domain